MAQSNGAGLNIAVVGTGISGLSAAWLLNQRHTVTVYESGMHIGGHSQTISAPRQGGFVPVDMGFIVYNPETYPNLIALFDHLDVPTQISDMSFAVSLHDGALEYAGTDVTGLFAQKRNLIRPRFWSMMRDLLRFYRDGTNSAGTLSNETLSLGTWLTQNNYGDAFIYDHLLPMAAAIWSTPAQDMLDYPAAAFLRFCENHGLLRLSGRAPWRTVVGGSQEYVRRLCRPFFDRIRLGCGVVSVNRTAGGVVVTDSGGGEATYDHIVIATHADQALRLLNDPSNEEDAVLRAITYRENDAVMHSDTGLMPMRRSVWSSWNYLGSDNAERVSVTYWMNRLQSLPGANPIFVTLNPLRAPAAAKIIHQQTYMHPQFNAAAMQAQRRVWGLQGDRNTWFCGSYFGAGFHEDGLQAGLAVAEMLGGLARPWSLPNPSSRIHVPMPSLQSAA